MLKKPLLCLLLAAAAPISSHADDVPAKLAAQLKSAVATNTGGQVQVKQVSTTPWPGVYEAMADGEVFYVDATGRFGFVGGSLMDLKARQDLTAKKLDTAMAIPFDRLPLQYAIKEVHGDGSKVFAVFEDPNCPICRSFTKFLDQLDDVTIYRFMFPVISPESQGLARSAWCSPDRAGVWKAMMAGARPQLNQRCDLDGLVEILALGERFQINNTPTVVLSSGKRLVGATPPEQFLQELEAARQLVARGQQR